MSSQQVSSQPFEWHYAEFGNSNFQIGGRTLFFVIVLFSVILVVTVLFIYSRWICRRLPPPQPASTSDLHLAHHQPPPPRRGLDLAAINSMPIILYKNSAAGDGNFSERECCICLGIFGDKEKVKVLPECRHCFHSECVDKWLTAESSCPICRCSLRVDSPV